MHEPGHSGGLLDKIAGKLFPAPSSDADGLITDDDYKNAQQQGLMSMAAGLLAASGPSTERKSFSQAFGESLAQAQQGYQGALKNTADQRGAALEATKMKFVIDQQKRARDARERIFSLYPPPVDSDDPVALEKWIRQTLPLWALSDPDMADTLTKTLTAVSKDSTFRNPMETDLGDHKEFIDPKTGETRFTRPKNPSPKDPNAPDHARELSDQRKFQREQQLGDDFNKDTTSPRQTAAKLRGAISEVPAALRGDGAAQVNILYAFVSAMDPQSAVREGEIGLAQAAAPLWSTANGYLQKVLNNQSVIVPGVLVKQMGELMKRRYAGLQGQVKERVGYYRGRARKWDVDESTFVELDPLDPETVQPKLPNESPEEYLQRVRGQ